MKGGIVGFCASLTIIFRLSLRRLDGLIALPCLDAEMGVVGKGSPESKKCISKFNPLDISY